MVGHDLQMIPYCVSNASDFWELSRVMRLHHYTWRNPDPALSYCAPEIENCKVHDCGYNPSADEWRMTGGAADPLMQDTVVDLNQVALRPASYTRSLLYYPF